MLTIIKFRFIAVWAIVLLLLSPGALAVDEAPSSHPPLTNQLGMHPSPYLALHGNDPVAWQAWGPEVLARARAENKPILISSGYFSCHWCHVMQRESFQDALVAEMLNSFFIPVKVDRELEPALDKRLMNYAQATLQRGGWPLNVFVSPDGIPVFATLYQPQQQFLEMLSRLTTAWQVQSDRIRELALEEIQSIKFTDAAAEIDPDWAGEIQALAIATIIARGDDIQGGFSQINKFPSVPQLRFLLHSLENSRNPEVIEFLELTLDAMANNGMRDHLGGGFFRYVVDPGWEIPHFEKMLYDNANLALLYLEAGERLGEPAYTEVARDTLDFMFREMRDESGALYASFSAIDSADIEGGYYLWDHEELQAVLNNQEYEVFSHTWNIERSHDLDTGNHLRDAKPISDTAIALEIEESEAVALLQAATGKLRTVRMQRELPTDNKLLASWNGLALTAFATAAAMLDDERYLQQAQDIHQFIRAQAWNGESLVRGIAQGSRIGSSAIDDYAYTAQGLYHWAQLSDEPEDYALAEAVLSQGWARFHRYNAWSYADHSLLPPEEGVEILPEEASASPSAVLIRTTLQLHNSGRLKDATLYRAALSALNRADDLLRSNPFWYASQIDAMRLVKQ